LSLQFLRGYSFCAAPIFARLQVLRGSSFCAAPVFARLQFLRGSSFCAGPVFCAGGAPQSPNGTAPIFYAVAPLRTYWLGSTFYVAPLATLFVTPHSLSEHCPPVIRTSLPYGSSGSAGFLVPWMTCSFGSAPLSHSAQLMRGCVCEREAVNRPPQTSFGRTATASRRTCSLFPRPRKGR
jgi:hypothetical protein